MAYNNLSFCRLRQLDAGDVPEGDEEEVDNGEVVDEDAVAEDSTEFDSAVSRLQSMYQEHLEEAEAYRLAKKKRRHKNEDDDSDDGDDDTAQGMYSNFLRKKCNNWY